MILGRLGEKTVKSSVLEVMVQGFTMLVVKVTLARLGEDMTLAMTLERLGEKAIKSFVLEGVAMQPTWMVVKRTLRRLGLKNMKFLVLEVMVEQSDWIATY